MFRPEACRLRRLSDGSLAGSWADRRACATEFAVI